MKSKRTRPVASPWHIRQPLKTWKRIVLQLAGIATVVALYAFMSYVQHHGFKLYLAFPHIPFTNTRLLPTIDINRIGNPTDTTIPTFYQFYEGIKTITEVRYDGGRWITTDIKATFGRLAWGMMISTGISIILGIMMGCYRSIEAFFGPIVSGAAKEPATAMLAAFFVLLGTGELLYTGVIVFGTLPWMTQAIFTAARQDVSREAVSKMITFNASPAEQVYNLVFKQTLPKIIESSKLATSAAMIGLLAAEMQVGDLGFGYRMKLNSRRLDMSVVYLYLIVLVLIGYTIDFAFNRMRDYLCPWFGEQSETVKKQWSFRLGPAAVMLIVAFHTGHQ